MGRFGQTFDLFSALYDLSIEKYEGKIIKAIKNAAEMSTSATGIQIMGTKPILPQINRADVIFAVAVVMVGGAFCIYAIFRILSHAPNKTMFWRIKVGVSKK